MPDAALPDTTILTQAFWDPSVREQLTTICTSITRPARPEGSLIYETDTDTILVYDGSGWLPVWARAASGRGTIGYVARTTDQAGITAVVDVGGLSITFTAAASRRYRITAEALMFGSVANDAMQLQITDAANTILQYAQLPTGVNVGHAYKLHCERVHIPSAGSVTYKVRALRAAGTGTLQISATANWPAFILVEDIGPN